MAASTLLTPGSILRFSGGFIAAPNFSAIVAKVRRSALTASRSRAFKDPSNSE
jgi:hypothetical protein